MLWCSRINQPFYLLRSVSRVCIFGNKDIFRQILHIVTHHAFGFMDRGWRKLVWRLEWWMATASSGQRLKWMEPFWCFLIQRLKTELWGFGQLVSSIKMLSLVSKLDKIKHVVCHRRQVFMILNNNNSKGVQKAIACDRFGLISWIDWAGSFLFLKVTSCWEKHIFDRFTHSGCFWQVWVNSITGLYWKLPFSKNVFLVDTRASHSTLSENLDIPLTTKSGANMGYCEAAPIHLTSEEMGPASAPHITLAIKTGGQAKALSQWSPRQMKYVIGINPSHFTLTFWPGILSLRSVKSVEPPKEFCYFFVHRDLGAWVRNG